MIIFMALRLFAVISISVQILSASKYDRLHLTETFWTSRAAPHALDKRSIDSNSTDIGLQFLSDRLCLLNEELKVENEFTDSHGVHHMYIQRTMGGIDVRFLVYAIGPVN
jgi:hypothetical protein